MTGKSAEPRKVMIMVAPNGARRTKTDHPALPMTIDEIAADAAACFDAGARGLPLHVRDDEGVHVLDAERYKAASAAVRAATDDAMGVQITTEAVGRYTPDEQMAVVRAVVPQAVSLGLRELIPDKAHEAKVRDFLLWCRDEGVSPQVILYDAGDVTRLLALCDSGVVPFAAPFVIFVLGRYAANQQSSPQDLDPFLTALGDAALPWSLCAFGARELDCMAAAFVSGGHARIGFENNLHLSDGSLAPNNAALVAETAEAARQLGHGLMDGGEAAAFLASVTAS